MIKEKVRKRREQISHCLQKSVISPSMIARQLDLPVSTVANDLYWMKKQATKWLSEHTLDGYVFVTKYTIDQLQDIEMDLQKMRNENPDPHVKLKIIRELIQLINIRWVMQGDGPALMNAKRVENLRQV